MQKLGDSSSTDTLSDKEIVDGIASITHAENKLAADKYTLLAQFSRRGLAAKVGHTKPSHWLAAGTRVAVGNAGRQFAVADWLTGWPKVLGALAGSDIHAAHVREIYEGYNHVRVSDPTLNAESLAGAVAELLAAAFDGNPNDVRVRAQELGHAAAADARARYEEKRREQSRRENDRQPEPAPDERPRDDHPDPNPDPGADDEDEDEDEPPIGPPPLPVSENPDLNRLDIFPKTNGRSDIRGDFDKILTEKLLSTISEHSRPQPGPDGSLDPRSASQRRADAFAHILDARVRVTDSNTPVSRVNATVRLHDLLRPEDDRASAPSQDNADWPFDLDWTGPISHSLARLIACDADVTPIIVDDNGATLAMGRTVRLATPEQRTAVTVRDRCCVKCGAQAQWCEVHHIVFWHNGGDTDITNLALFCPTCHRDIHHRGWDVAMGDDGHPYLVPPDTVDPDRKPMRSYHRRRRPVA